MRVITKLVAGAALCAGLVTLNNNPAAALDREIGAVNVSSTNFTDVRWSRFGGPLDHVTFVPVNDAITCEHITINYMDGTTHDVFSGHIMAGQHTTISLPPPNDGRVRDVNFACKAETLDGARIILSAATDSWPSGWDSVGPAKLTTETMTR